MGASTQRYMGSGEKEEKHLEAKTSSKDAFCLCSPFCPSRSGEWRSCSRHSFPERGHLLPVPQPGRGGQLCFFYSNPLSHREESGNVETGVVRGSYTTAWGRTIHYVADNFGFRSKMFHQPSMTLKIKIFFLENKENLRY